MLKKFAEVWCRAEHMEELTWWIDEAVFVKALSSEGWSVQTCCSGLVVGYLWQFVEDVTALEEIQLYYYWCVTERNAVSRGEKICEPGPIQDFTSLRQRLDLLWKTRTDAPPILYVAAWLSINLLSLFCFLYYFLLFLAHSLSAQLPTYIFLKQAIDLTLPDLLFRRKKSSM